MRCAWGRAAKPGGLLFALWDPRVRTAQHAIRGVRRHLCDGRLRDRDTKRAYTPAHGSLASHLLSRLRPGERRRLKRGAVAPQRVEDATEAPGEGHHRDAPAAAVRHSLHPRAEGPTR